MSEAVSPFMTVGYGVVGREEIMAGGSQLGLAAAAFVTGLIAGEVTGAHSCRPTLERTMAEPGTTSHFRADVARRRKAVG